MAKDNVSEGGAPKGGGTPAAVGSETPAQQVEAMAALQKSVSELTEQLNNSSTQTKDLQGEIQSLKRKSEALEDGYLQELAKRSETSALDESELSPEGASIVKHLEGRFQQMETQFGNREAGVRKDLSHQTEAEVVAYALKRDNPEIWGLVGPRAVAVATASGGTLTVQEAWDAAKVELKPYLDAKTALDTRTADEAKKAAGEKPSPGGDPALSPAEFAAAKYDELGIAENFKADAVRPIGSKP